MSSNIDVMTVNGFGEEWSAYDQSTADHAELERIFDEYFERFPWQELPPQAVGFDLGCGSGRWAKFVANRVGHLHCVDASPAALEVAQRNLAQNSNCEFHCASVDQMPILDGTMDFGYSLGVLHHVPDTAAGIRSCVAKLKPGSPFLVYLYYALDNKPWWFRALWRVSDIARQMICRLPFGLRNLTTTLIAVGCYWPLSRLAWLVEQLGLPVESIPLAAYRNRSFYCMQTDALDRFGTRLEQRFTANQIRQMMESAGLERVVFASSGFWSAVGFRKAAS